MQDSKIKKIDGSVFSLKKIKEDIANFYNITLTRHEAKRLDGLNVRIERSDYKVTKFYSFKEFSTVDEAVRAAILCRNEHYKKAGYPSFLCRSLISELKTCDISDTGWSGIRVREKRDTRRNTSRKHVSFSCPIPKSGKITTKDISLMKHGDILEQAIHEAVGIKRDSTNMYNAIVPVFNDLMTKSVMAACLTEFRTLNPTLQFMKTNAERMWEQAYKMVHD